MSSLLEVGSEDLERHATLVDEIYAGTALGVVVRNVLDRDAVQRALDRLQRADASAPRSELVPRAYTLGIMLAPTAPRPDGPDFETYLRVSAGWSAVALLGAEDHRRIDAALSALAGGRPVEVPTTPDGRSYAPATLRVFLDGGGAPAHCDTYPPLACHRHLDSIVDRATQISWYVPLSVPEAGGTLTIFSLAHGQPSAAAPERALERSESVRYSISPGDLLVFDGGRRFHRVDVCSGPTPRRTFGGFAGLSQAHDRLYRWS
jgi:hypothetical protein